MGTEMVFIYFGEMREQEKLPMFIILNGNTHQ